MPAKNKKPNELNIVRVYDAPVKTVWNAWTDPKVAAKWWGPRGFSITTLSKDLRPGGSWKYVMHGPDGVDYPNETKYFEVEECAKLVYDHGANADQPPLFRVTVLFSESKGKTTMDMTMSFATSEITTEMKKFIKQAGGNSTWDRLGEFLERESSGREKFVFNRTFESSLEEARNAVGKLGLDQAAKTQIAFAEESPTSTRLTIVVNDPDSKEQLFKEWVGSFEKLEKHLKTTSF